MSSENYVEISSRVGVLESQLSTLKQEKSRLTAELDISKMKLGTLEDEKNRWIFLVFLIKFYN